MNLKCFHQLQLLLVTRGAHGGGGATQAIQQVFNEGTLKVDIFACYNFYE